MNTKKHSPAGGRLYIGLNHLSSGGNQIERQPTQSREAPDLLSPAYPGVDPTIPPAGTLEGAAHDGAGMRELPPHG